MIKSARYSIQISIFEMYFKDDGKAKVEFHTR